MLVEGQKGQSRRAAARWQKAREKLPRELAASPAPCRAATARDCPAPSRPGPAHSVARARRGRRSGRRRQLPPARRRCRARPRRRPPAHVRAAPPAVRNRRPLAACLLARDRGMHRTWRCGSERAKLANGDRRYAAASEHAWTPETEQEPHRRSPRPRRRTTPPRPLAPAWHHIGHGP
jgi:hypothetical protein